MNGILLVDKPKGISSFDVIRKLRTQLTAEHGARSTESGEIRNPKSEIRLPKIGHAGTLDPMATGLLIILLGKACKQADQFLKLDKCYEAELTLGATSDTDDAEGKIVQSPKSKVIKPTQKQIAEALERFTGEISQVPPQHSAIKVGGKRAYSLARKGQIVELKPRQVTIYDLQITSYKYPILRIDCKVSSGTYIRSLARDMGKKLGIGAYLSGLRRTQVGDFNLKKAVSAINLTAETVYQNLQSFESGQQILHK